MLDIQSISTSYGKRLALQDLSLAVQSGEILAVIGPNGAGKSTLIRAVSGILPLLQGRVSISGKDLARLNPAQRARLVAVTPQARNLPPAFSVYETVLLGRTPHLGWMGQAGASDHARVHQSLERTGTLDLAERRVGELSGGEQQLVLLARALAQDTPVLLLDEPTTHLDLQHQTRLLQLVRDLASRHDLAILLVVHDLNLAGLYADQLALLVEGKLWAIGSPAEVLTSENLSAIYQIPVEVIRHPRHGTPLVLPDGIHDLDTQG
jgi:ABC-type cobalamin/Fe3+-siderophores transport system ATPase subunit